MSGSHNFTNISYVHLQFLCRRCRSPAWGFCAIATEGILYPSFKAEKEFFSRGLVFLKIDLFAFFGIFYTVRYNVVWLKTVVWQVFSARIMTRRACFHAGSEILSPGYAIQSSYREQISCYLNTPAESLHLGHGTLSWLPCHIARAVQLHCILHF